MGETAFGFLDLGVQGFEGGLERLGLAVGGGAFALGGGFGGERLFVGADDAVEVL